LEELQKSADLDEEYAVATARFLIRTLKSINLTRQAVK